MVAGFLLGVSHILTNTPYFILIGALFWRQRRVSSRATVLVLGAFVLAHGVSDFLLTAFFGGTGFWTHIQFAVFCVGVITLLLLVFRISFAKALHAFLLFRAIYIAINYVVLNVFMLTQPGQYVGFDATPLYTLAVLVVTGAAFPLLWRYFTGRLRTALSELGEATIRQLCVPPVLFFLLDQCYSSIRSTLKYDSFQTAGIFALILVAGLVTYYVNLRAAIEIAEKVRNEAKTENRLSLQAQHYKQLTETVEHARAARHDLRHHLSVISAYLKKDDKDGMRNYLNEYLGNMPDDTISALCQNYAVDAVVRHYLNIAKDAGTALDVRLHLPENIGIPNSDLCIVFGNIFENAAESCTRQERGKKFISARCEAKDGRLTLAVDNSGDETPAAREDRFRGQGIGLQSVRAVAEKWNGSLKFVREDGIYKTSVIMTSE